MSVIRMLHKLRYCHSNSLLKECERNLQINKAFQCCRSRRSISGSVVSSPNEKYEDGKRESELPAKPAESQVSTKQAALKRKQKNPFVKELFLGKFDKDILLFPEVLDPERLAALKNTLTPIENFIQNVDSQKIDQEGKIPDTTFQDMKTLGLFGLLIPKEYGGSECNLTEFSRISEVTSWDSSVTNTYVNHQLNGSMGILKYGTDAQQNKYLPKLATGEHIASFCLTESESGSDVNAIQTTAKLSEDGSYYILNGSKIWVTNGNLAEIFTVFAKTTDEFAKERVTAFIVERSFGGVKNGPLEDKFGTCGIGTCSVHFDNTRVPVENILGEKHEGLKVAGYVLCVSRLSIGSMSAGILKKLMALTAEHAINRVQFNKPLKDFQLIQEKIAKMAYSLYAIESMVYLTTGIIDLQERNDYMAETALVKIFASEEIWHHVSECLQIFAGLAYMKEAPIERVLRDVRAMQIIEGTNDMLRLYVALSGCQYAGKELADSVRKIRNPLHFPGFAFSKMWERRRHLSDKPVLHMDLQGYLHPSLHSSAKLLEYSVLRLQYTVEVALGQHGLNITDQQVVLKRLANVVTDIYAMTSCLARASRSYCIGLPNSNIERIIAHAFCENAIARVKINIDEILDGPFLTSDINNKNIAADMFKNKGYCIEHPLSRMWS